MKRSTAPEPKPVLVRGVYPMVPLGGSHWRCVPCGSSVQATYSCCEPPICACHAAVTS